MTPTSLQKAQAWQKQLDKAVAEIVYEDAHSFIQATATAGRNPAARGNGCHGHPFRFS